MVRKNIVVKDIRFEKYAIIVFDFNIHKTRKKLRIETIGRLGEWDYFWSAQSLLSILNIINI